MLRCVRIAVIWGRGSDLLGGRYLFEYSVLLKFPSCLPFKDSYFWNERPSLCELRVARLICFVNRLARVWMSR